MLRKANLLLITVKVGLVYKNHKPSLILHLCT
jgi:hypothetical protein